MGRLRSCCFPLLQVAVMLPLFLLYHLHSGCHARMLWSFPTEMEEMAEVMHTRRHLQSASYCVAVATADQTKLQTALDWACGSGLGNVDCSAILSGGSCYNPNTLVAHASYAFDSYYVNQNAASQSCYFNGLATVTSTNPSNGTCTYPAYTGSTTPTSNTTSPTPTSPSPSSNTTFSPTTGDNSTFSPTSTTAGTSGASTPFSFSLLIHGLCGGILVLILFSKL